jgi:H/ACA ribonucleoprotein complex non-core subunit NAF1
LTFFYRADMDRDYDKDILELGGQGLPIVDDIQIAAAAAASEVKQSESSAPSSSTCSSSDDEIDECDEGEETKVRPSNRACGEMGNAQCLVRLETLQEGKIAVRINVQGAGRSASADHSFDSSDEDEDEDNDDEEELESESDIEEIQDYGEIRRIIDAMDGENEDVSTFPPAASELFGSVPAPRLEEFSIAPDEPLSEAGQIMSVIEGTIVVRACSGSRALDEGSILVLENRSVLGIVEDIFGPVQAPLYALRCSSKLSDDVKPQAKVYSVDRLAQFVLPDQLRVKGYDDGEAVSGEESAQQEEVHFSDDEAVSGVDLILIARDLYCIYSM